MKRDYDLLARAVDCPYCGAKTGARCFGARPGTVITHTHHLRRRLATAARRGFECLQPEGSDGTDMSVR
jgi:hypothetical protein